MPVLVPLPCRQCPRPPLVPLPCRQCLRHLIAPLPCRQCLRLAAPPRRQRFRLVPLPSRQCLPSCRWRLEPGSVGLLVSAPRRPDGTAIQKSPRSRCRHPSTSCWATITPSLPDGARATAVSAVSSSPACATAVPAVSSSPSCATAVPAVSSSPSCTTAVPAVRWSVSVSLSKKEHGSQSRGTFEERTRLTEPWHGCAASSNKDVDPH